MLSRTSLRLHTDCRLHTSTPLDCTPLRLHTTTQHTRYGSYDLTFSLQCADGCVEGVNPRTYALLLVSGVLLPIITGSAPLLITSGLGIGTWSPLATAARDLYLGHYRLIHSRQHGWPLRWVVRQQAATHHVYTSAPQCAPAGPADAHFSVAPTQRPFTRMPTPQPGGSMLAYYYK